MKRFLIFMLLFCGSVSLTFAEGPAKDLAKAANSLLRQAESKFFAGKIEDADELLKQAEQNLEKAKALEKAKTKDAGATALKTLQGKHDRLRQRVDQKLQAGEKPASAAGRVTQTQDSPGIKPLSHGASSNLKQAGQEMDFAEKELAKGEQSLATGAYNLVKSYSFNLGEKLKSSEALLAKVVNNNKADPEHPEVAPALQRLRELQAKYAKFKQQAAGQQSRTASLQQAAKAEAEAMNEKWLPQIKPFIDYSGSKKLQFPGLHHQTELAQQDQNFAEAKSLLADCEQQTSGLELPHELAQAVKDLQFKLTVYEQERNAESSNRVEPIKSTLSEWQRRLAENKNWNPDSGSYLFVVSPQKIAYQKEQITSLGTTMPDQADRMSSQLAEIELENAVWQKEKSAWANRPQPFPAAGMTDRKLLAELTGLLNDRGIDFSKLHIIDKDWWVLKGEYRYMKGAFLARDGQGEFWSAFNFRQIETLSGYRPTEIWEVSEQKLRLP